MKHRIRKLHIVSAMLWGIFFLANVPTPLKAVMIQPRSSLDKCIVREVRRR
jgi:hypothetical protein